MICKQRTNKGLYYNLFWHFVKTNQRNIKKYLFIHNYYYICLLNIWFLFTCLEKSRCGQFAKIFRRSIFCCYTVCSINKTIPVFFATYRNLFRPVMALCTCAGKMLVGSSVLHHHLTLNYKIYIVIILK